MTRRAALVLGGTIVVGATLAVQSISARVSPDFVAIDAVVVDDAGRTIDDLKPGDFSVREDGRTVAIDSFDEVSATGAGRDRGARTVVIVLDDSSLPPSLTPRVQNIAGLFVNRMGVDDRVSVVRANSRTDEAVFGRNQAEMRIAEYRAGSLPFFGRESFEIALYNSNDFARAVDQTWREAGHYYMLGYRPAWTSRELHDVEVQVDRPGARVHARRTRG